MPEFDAWAVYYDYIHQGLPGEAEFYVEQAVRCGGPVLELGCGTGRIAIPAAMTGADVAGLDNSRAMLAVCAEKLRAVEPVKGRIRLIEGDMRDFTVEPRFALIMLPYRTFMHLLTPADQAACLSCCRRHLQPNGQLVLNVWAARPSAIAKWLRQPAEWIPGGGYPVPGEDVELRQYYRVQYDEYDQRIEETHRILEVHAEDATVHEEMLTLTRAWITPREMTHLASRCGFTVERLLGGFDGAPFGRESSEMIWCLRR